MGLDTIRQSNNNPEPEVQGGDVLIDRAGNSSTVLPEAAVNYGSQQRGKAFFAEYNAARESYRKNAGGLFMGYPDNLLDRAYESFYRKYYEGNEVDPFTKRAIPGSGALVDANWIIDLGVGGIYGLFKAGLSTAKGIGNINIPVYRVYGGGAGRFGNFWTPINPRLYGSTYRNFAGLPSNNSGAFMLKGNVRLGDINGFGFARPLDGNFGRLVPELRIRASWNKVIWSPSNVTRANF